MIGKARDEAAVTVRGAPCWVNLAARELPAAHAFYAAVMGWTFRPGGLGDEFSVALHEGVPVAGIAAVANPMGISIAWTPFFSVDNADTAAARVGERSGTVAVGPMRIGKGRAAIAADTAGAQFGFWQGAVRSSWCDGPPPARLELRTRDVFAAAMFYGGVFDWGSDRGDRCQVEYVEDAVVLRNGPHTAATLRDGGIEAAPDPQIRPRWHVYFYVDDVDAAVEAAVRWGGKLLSGPAPDTWGRTAAALRDPDGALFAVAARKA